MSSLNAFLRDYSISEIENRYVEWVTDDTYMILSRWNNWKMKNAKPKPSKMAIEIAKRMGVKDVEPYESALVRVNLEYCKRRKCEKCPVQKFCKKFIKK